MKSGIIIILLVFTSFHNIQAFISPDITYGGWYLDQEEAYAIKLSNVLVNGSDDFMTINVYSQEDGISEFQINLTAGVTIGFGRQVTPDWSVDESELIGINGYVKNGLFTLDYPAPWTVNPDHFQGDGPSMFFPMIPIGDDTYFSSIESSFSGLGYTVMNNATHFGISYSNSTYAASVVYGKSNGLMASYSYVGTIGNSDLEFEGRIEWILSPSRASDIGWYSENPLLDYRILNAMQSNGTAGVPLEAGDHPGEPGQPVDANGMFYKDQILRTSLSDFRGFENSPGYWLQFSTDTGYVVFNITIELPQDNPVNNSLYLYPLLPQTDLALIEGYFGVSDIYSGQYSHSFAGNEVTLNIDAGNVTFSATWFVDSGIMKHWYLNDSSTSGDGPNMVLEFELIDYASADDLDISLAATIGEGITYRVDQLLINGSDQMNFEEGTGYITVGDLVYFEPVFVKTDFENGPPFAGYNIIGDNGHEDNVTFIINYPTDTSHFDGPPFLLPHFIQGNAAFYNWLSTLYGAIGATFTTNSSYIHFAWEFENDFGSTITIDVTWRMSDGALIHYYANNEGSSDPNDQAYTLEFSYVDDGQVTTTPTSPISNGGIDLPIFSGDTALIFIFTIITIPILRKKFRTDYP